jgi:predicted nucleic acid-binding protein
VIVVDTNMVAYLFLPTVHTPRVEALFDRDPEWAAPALWRSELRNVLAQYLRRRALTFAAACDIQAEAESLLAGNEYDVSSVSVLELARDSGCSAYDCEFVALAQRLGVKLVTSDAQVLRAFPKTAVSLPDATR